MNTRLIPSAHVVRDRNLTELWKPTSNESGSPSRGSLWPGGTALCPNNQNLTNPGQSVSMSAPWAPHPDYNITLQAADRAGLSDRWAQGVHMFTSQNNVFYERGLIARLGCFVQVCLFSGVATASCAIQGMVALALLGVAFKDSAPNEACFQYIRPRNVTWW